MSARPNTLDVLRLGRERIDIGWTQGVRARRAPGARCDPADSKAVAWCALGAVDSDERAVFALLAVIEPATSCLWWWNDVPERTRAEVLAVFDAAILAQGAHP